MRRLGSAYEDVRENIVQLAGDLDGRAKTTHLSACPDWSVHDAVAHLTGVCTDILSGNLQGSATDEWTAAQVEARRDRDTSEVLAEWNVAGSQIAALLDDFPGWYGDQMVADMVSHEHDIRGAVNRPGPRDTEAISIGLDFAVEVILHSALRAYGLGPLEVDLGDSAWVVGGGNSPTGDADAWRAVAESKEPVTAPTEPPVAKVGAERFEFFRAVTGRRSAQQIRSFEWTADPEPYLVGFSHGPFTLRSTDLVETRFVG